MEASWPTPSDLYPSGWGGKSLQLGNNGEETKWLPPGSGNGERLLVRLAPPVFPPLECGRNQECDWPFAELASGPWACLLSSLSISSGAPRSSGLGYWYLPSSSGPGKPFTSPNPQSRRGTGSPEPDRGAFPSLPPSGCPLAPDGSLSLHRDRTGEEGVVALAEWGTPGGLTGAVGDGGLEPRASSKGEWGQPSGTQSFCKPGKKSGETP